MTDEIPPDLTESEDEDPFEHGRVGYGSYAKYTPLILAIIIILLIAWVGWKQFRPDSASDRPSAGSLIDRPAPDWNLTLLDGSNLASSNLEGGVAVLNFWASWCVPCETEMPVLEQLHNDLLAENNPVTIVGIGIKRDNNDNALAMVDRLGITYPVGRDTAGANDTLGPITEAFGIDTYPATVFVRPDGVVSAVVFGPLTTENARKYIDAASTPV